MCNIEDFRTIHQNVTSNMCYLHFQTFHVIFGTALKFEIFENVMMLKISKSMAELFNL